MINFFLQKYSMLYAFLIILLVSAPGIYPQNFYFVKSNASGANNGTSWQDAFINLQDALRSAAEGDTVFVAEGIYYPDRGTNISRGNRNASFILKQGVVLIGGYKGNEQFSKSGNIYNKYWRDWRRNETIISGDLLDNDNSNISATEPTRSDNSYHIFYSTEPVDSTTEINGFYIQGGNANFNNLMGSSGGALYTGNCYLQVKNCTFRNNSALDKGGAVYSPAGNPRFKFVTFINNSAKNGGAVFMTGNDHLNHPTVAYIVNSYFYDNNATEKGGGLYAAFGVNPVVANTVFLENSASVGGGIYADARSYPEIVNSTFYKNNALSAGGGASLCAGTIMNAVFRSNTAASDAQIFLEKNPDYSPAQRVFKNSTVQGGFQGSQVLDFDPLFIDPANPAGPDGFFGTADDGLALQTSSRAVNTAIANLYDFSDVRGFPRQSKNIPDMGAYESQRIPVDYAQLYNELKKGGYILVYRHGRTDWRTTDLPNFASDLGNCSLQRNLSEEGREQVKYLGSMIKLLNIPVGKSISSPACRCVETGTAVSGGATLKTSWMLEDSVSRLSNIEDLKIIPPSGVNGVIATHMGVIAKATTFPTGEVNEGDVVVIKPTGTGFQEIGQITTDTWEIMAELIPNNGSNSVENNNQPQQIVLYDNYPNPFNPSTTIRFSIPMAQHVTLKIFDAVGRQVSELVNEYRQQGDYSVDFNAAGLSSGIYFYSLNAGAYSKTKKLVIMK